MIDPVDSPLCSHTFSPREHWGYDIVDPVALSIVFTHFPSSPPRVALHALTDKRIAKWIHTTHSFAGLAETTAATVSASKSISASVKWSGSV